MNAEEAFVVERHRAVTKPIDDFIQIRGLKNRIKRIAWRKFSLSCADRKEMQFVITEQAFGVLHAHHGPDRLQRLRTAIDDIADENKTTLRGQLLEQQVQRIKTAVNISDCKSFQSILR